jgi:hypothetical protein
MGARKFLLTLSLVLLCQTDAFAGAHTVTYVRRTQPLGTQVTLGGTTFDLIRVPVRLLSGEQYSLIVPAARFDPDFGSVNIQALHATGSFVANATVDTYPAHVAVTDRRYYTLTGNVGGAGVARTADSAAGAEAIIIGGTTFNVGTGVAMTVTIKIGTTLVRYAVELNRDLLQTNVDVGPAYNIVPYAEWGKYRDPLDLVKALNDLLDYIRVIPL